MWSQFSLENLRSPPNWSLQLFRRSELGLNDFFVNFTIERFNLHQKVFQNENGVEVFLSDLEDHFDEWQKLKMMQFLKKDRIKGFCVNFHFLLDWCSVNVHLWESILTSEHLSTTAPLPRTSLFFTKLSLACLNLFFAGKSSFQHSYLRLLLASSLGICDSADSL